MYRLFLSGSIEEVILQRQLIKKDIADVAVDHFSVGEGKLDKDELREIFRLKDVPCQTYELMNKKKRDKTKKRVIEDEDQVWRKYVDSSSIVDDPLLREVVQKGRRREKH